MKFSLYPKLAWNGITKNRKLYVPYILTCIGMVVMSYIMQSLSYSPLIHEIPHGADLEMILSFGKFVIATFALIFLFYTNSFIIRRRKKEFGLFNVLGMGKWSICAIVIWENIIVSLISLCTGIFVGMALSKLAELGLSNAVGGGVSFRFTFNFEAVSVTLIIFCIIFFILLLRSVLSVLRTGTMSLLKSENYGEKPPRANWVIAALGVVILGIAYYLAVSIKSPLTALLVFFIAVIMVIVATYLLFIAGSVALCRLLQKNKRYYYKKNHFVSVSSMVFRMKRNGAGLASICILSTMVLVMVSTTSSLFFGVDEILASRFPMKNEIALSVDKLENTSPENTEIIRAELEKAFAENGRYPDAVKNYCYAYITGMQNGDTVNPDVADEMDNLLAPLDNVRTLYFMSQSDYNKTMGTSLSLKENEALICPKRCTYEKEKLNTGDISLNVVGQLTEFPEIADANVAVIPSLMIVIPDYEILSPITELRDFSGDRMLTVKYYYGWDLDADSDTVIKIFHDVSSRPDNLDMIKDEEGSYSSLSSCLVEEKADFFTTFGGLFFLGIMLSIVFLFATVMIIYYKQVSEGYEDRARFEIMQKVGMTKKEIKKSINSQVLTVFFAPLLFAGVHLAFAFPMISKLLLLFNLHNIGFIILVTLIAFVIFCIFYAIVYKVTAKAYYSIVSSDK